MWHGWRSTAKVWYYTCFIRSRCLSINCKKKLFCKYYTCFIRSRCFPANCKMKLFARKIGQALVSTCWRRTWMKVQTKCKNPFIGNWCQLIVEGSAVHCTDFYFLKSWNERVLQWRNWLAHGTYKTVRCNVHLNAIRRNAEVVSSSLTWRIILYRKSFTLNLNCSKNVERFTILRVILAQGPC